jgi:hypothetical protein
MAFHVTTLHDGILSNSLQASSMLPQRHINQTIPHKDIRPTTTFNEMLMKRPALFKRNYFGRCISTPPKGLTQPMFVSKLRLWFDFMGYKLHRSQKNRWSWDTHMGRQGTQKKLLIAKNLSSTSSFTDAPKRYKTKWFAFWRMFKTRFRESAPVQGDGRWCG